MYGKEIINFRITCACCKEFIIIGYKYIYQVHSLLLKYLGQPKPCQTLSQHIWVSNMIRGEDNTQYHFFPAATSAWESGVVVRSRSLLRDNGFLLASYCALVCRLWHPKATHNNVLHISISEQPVCSGRTGTKYRPANNVTSKQCRTERRHAMNPRSFTVKEIHARYCGCTCGNTWGGKDTCVGTYTWGGGAPVLNHLKCINKKVKPSLHKTPADTHKNLT